MLTPKFYKWTRIVVTIVLGIIISQAVIFDNLFLALVSIIIAWIVLFYLRSKTTEILADERDYQVSGESARWAINIFAIIAVVFILLFNSQKGINPSYEAISITLSYSVCLLMIIYTLFFRFYHQLQWFKNKEIWVFAGIVIIGIMIIGGLRLLSGEDDWICQNGQWIEHGHPSWPAPTQECK